MDESLIIVAYLPAYADAFYELNIEWLRKYFYVEPYDEEVLRNPDKYIINKGGHIFFAIIDTSVVGTLALMPTASDGVLELTKMAVSPELRGRKIGQKLMQFSIDFARSEGFDALVLYSNTILENAIYIYRKYGFKEVPLEANGPYKRGNIKMILELI
ncbi:MAG: GNAT family N-acetyltransferase [Flavobacteriaceae bacterium]|nr:GNAT family N-acetyltransferase [Flavobacteriaceae bacterium]